MVTNISPWQFVQQMQACMQHATINHISTSGYSFQTNSFKIGNAIKHYEKKIALSRMTNLTISFTHLLLWDFVSKITNFICLQPRISELMVLRSKDYLVNKTFHLNQLNQGLFLMKLISMKCLVQKVIFRLLIFASFGPKHFCSQWSD